MKATQGWLSLSFAFVFCFSLDLFLLRLRAVSLFPSVSHVRERVSSGEVARREKRVRHARVHSRAFCTTD